MVAIDPPSEQRRIPARGDIWLVVFDPVVGREQAGTRPGLIVSSDDYHAVQDGLVIALAITSRDRGYPTHVALPIGSAGLSRLSYVMVDQMRGISTQRLLRFMGRVDSERMSLIDRQLGQLLSL